MQWLRIDLAPATRPRGFTVIELMIASSIIVIISTIMIVNFRSGKERDELRDAANTVASYLQQAQTYSLAGRTGDFGYGPQVPPGGYGVQFLQADNRLYFFADFFANGDPANGHAFESDYDTAEEYNMSDLFGNVYFSSLCFSNDSSNSSDCAIGAVDFIYDVPGGNRYINNGPANTGWVEFKLRHNNLPNQHVLIRANAASGQITVSPITGG